LPPMKSLNDYRKALPTPIHMAFGA
jgi:hypothetical protein